MEPGRDLGRSEPWGWELNLESHQRRGPLTPSRGLLLPSEGTATKSFRLMNSLFENPMILQSFTITVIGFDENQMERCSVKCK